MDGIKSDPQRQSVAVPFRILPSTGPRPLRLLVLGGLLIIGCGGLAIEIGIVSGALPPIGNWGSVSWRTTYNGQPSADGAWVMIAILAVALALTLYNLGREIFYLRRGSRYWIEISSGGISLISPLARRDYRWESVSPFALRTLRTRSWRILRIAARAGGWRWVWIRSDDFATELADSRREAAEILVGTLNDVLCQVGAGRNSIVQLPAGLRIEAATDFVEKPIGRVATVVRGR